MNRPSPVEFRRTLLTLTAAMVSGALAGAIAGWTVAPFAEVPEVQTVKPSTENPGNATTTPETPDVTVIPVERIPQAQLLPAPFIERRLSAVASVYRREKGVDTLLTDERLISQAVSVTSDGWFVLPGALPEGLRIADLVVWHEGVSATPTRAVIDRLSGVVFLKTPLTNLNAPAFARATDVTPGLATWLERRAKQFEPTGIVADNETLQTVDGISSEVAGRRGLVSGKTGIGDRGAALWSANGALIGVIASAADEPLRYVPASTWTASLASLLSNGDIHHALLGVRSTDLAWVRLQDGSLPERGAWLHEDKRSKKPAVTPATPAAISGLRAGDVIQRVDRDILDGTADLGELLAEYRPGSRVTLTVLRGTQVLEMPVELGSVVTSEVLK